MKDFLELMYYGSGIFLTIGVFIGLKQLQTAKKEIEILNRDYETKNKRIAIESSIKYLEVAKRIIVDMVDYSEKANKKDGDKTHFKSLYNEEFKLEYHEIQSGGKQLITELILSLESGIENIFNELEVFSVAMLNGLADEQIVYTPFGKVFCEFIEREYLFLCFARGQGAPFENVVELYKTWKSRMELQSLELQKQDLLDKIKDKDKKATVKSPIGM